MKSRFFILACMLVSTALVAQIDFEHEEWARVKKQAKNEGKIVFVDAYTTWCGPCKWMSNTVFTDNEVGKFYNANFINLKLDMEKGEGLSFAEDYEVNAYPTLLFIDGDGKLLHKHLGAVPADRFISIGNDALTPEKRIGSLMSEYEENKDNKEFLHEYLMRMFSAGVNVNEEATHYFDMLDSDEFVSKDNLVILMMWRPGSSTKAFQSLYMHRKEFYPIAGEEEVNGLMESVITMDMNRAIARDDAEAFHRVQAINKGMDTPFKESVDVMGKMNYSKAQNDVKGYLKYAKTYTRKYHWNDWNTLNNSAWEMYLSESVEPSDMKLAVKLAKRAVELEENYFTTDTYAATLYKTGKFDDALTWANRAVELATEAGDDHSETDQLISKIKSARKEM